MKTYEVKKVQSDISSLEAIDWGKVNAIEDFQYPWNPELTASMSFKGCWNDTSFFFRFDVDDDTLHVFNETGSKEEVVLSDRVEIFFKINDKNQSQTEVTPTPCQRMGRKQQILVYIRYQQLHAVPHTR